MRIGSVLVDSSQLQGFAVVERRVAAAMMYAHRMFLRDLVEIVNVQLAIVLHLRVVEEISVDPNARGRLLGFGAELVDDAGDGDELDLIRVADEDFVEQDVAARVIVAIDESGHDGHLLCVEGLRPFADERLGFCCAPYVDEPSALDRESLRLRHAGIDGVDLGVENHQIGMARIGISALAFLRMRLCSEGCRWPATPAPVMPRNSLRLWRYVFIDPPPYHLHLVMFCPNRPLGRPKNHRDLLGSPLSCAEPIVQLNCFSSHYVNEEHSVTLSSLSVSSPTRGSLLSSAFLAMPQLCTRTLEHTGQRFRTIPRISELGDPMHRDSPNPLYAAI